MIKKITMLVLMLSLSMPFNSCQDEQAKDEIKPDFVKREIEYSLTDSLIEGASYLSVYSQIYNQNEHKTYDLTATVSIRNVNRHDTIYIDKAEYFNTDGSSIRNYFKNTVFVAPMETIEIVIDETDQEGGTGANFIFEWRIDPKANEPLFEAVMISSFGQGLSFTTQGKRLEHFQY